MKKKLLVFLVLVLSTPLLFSENIRGDVVKRIHLTNNFSADENSFSMKIEDVFSISCDENIDFLKGVEIEIEIPAVFNDFKSSIAFEIFKQIAPEVSNGIGTYYGKKYNMVFIPESSKFYLQIPFNNSLEQEKIPYTTVFTEVLDIKDFPLLISVIPVTKGFSSALYNKEIKIRVSPILEKTGTLDYNIILDEQLNSDLLNLSIDGKKISTKLSDTISLTSGRHILSAEISGGLTSTETFSIRPDTTTSVTIEINSLDSFLIIDVPENTGIYLDGELRELEKGNIISTKPGEHTILFMIGDYKISKRFSVSPGKDCKISLFLDILVN